MQGRRPLASRDTAWARAAARRLTAAGASPNRISQASVAFAALAGAALWLSGVAEGQGPRAALLVLAALAVQARLLCNLLDGMVAVEGGRAAPDGPFWNEAPDRAADLLILVGAGLGCGAPSLGWAAGAFAVLTAYVRELGAARGLPPDFSGPMAKPHRMALVTAAALVAAVEPLWGWRGEALTAALWAAALGAALTAARRARRLVATLRSGAGS